MIVNLDAPPTLLRNEGGNRKNWLMVSLREEGANRQAIGARVTVVAAERLQVREVRAGASYLSQDDLRLHFGLGARQAVAQVEIRWPIGETELVRDVAANQLITVVRGRGIVATGFGPPLTASTWLAAPSPK